jgi:hypothetical protein
MMPEPNEVTLSWWMVVTDKSEYKLSESEMEDLMTADSRGVRFVRYDKFMLNTAFIKEAYRKREKKDLRFNIISGEDKKFVLDNDKQITDGK